MDKNSSMRWKTPQQMDTHQPAQNFGEWDGLPQLSRRFDSPYGLQGGHFGVRSSDYKGTS